jgi:4-oxalocrotonate tautomerase
LNRVANAFITALFIVRSLVYPIANVRVWIQDVPKENWGIAGVSAKDLGR